MRPGTPDFWVSNCIGTWIILGWSMVRITPEIYLPFCLSMCRAQAILKPQPMRFLMCYFIVFIMKMYKMQNLITHIVLSCFGWFQSASQVTSSFSGAGSFAPRLMRSRNKEKVFVRTFTRLVRSFTSWRILIPQSAQQF